MVGLLAQFRMDEAHASRLGGDWAEHVERRLARDEERPEELEGDLIVLEKRREIVERAAVRGLEVTDEVREMIMGAAQR